MGDPEYASTPLTAADLRRAAAVREAAILTKGDATDTVILANFILTGTDEVPGGSDTPE